MINLRSYVNVVDNSGCLLAQCVGLPKPNISANVGDIIIVSLKIFSLLKKNKKGSVMKAVIVRTRKQRKLLTGDFLSFGENAVVLLNSQLLPQYKRLFGPVSTELFVRDNRFNFKAKFLRVLALTTFKI